jgi:hypothetical protein
VHALDDGYDLFVVTDAFSWRVGGGLMACPCDMAEAYATAIAWMRRL